MPQAKPINALHQARAAHSAQKHAHSHAGADAHPGSKPKLYNPRHPEHTLLYRTLAEHFETGAAQVDKAALHIGAVAFIHRFGSSLNEHVHFHVCVVDGVFEVVAGEVDADAQATAPGVFLPRRTFVFTRPVESTRLSWPRCRPICADASCAPSWAAA